MSGTAVLLVVVCHVVGRCGNLGQRKWERGEIADWDESDDLDQVDASRALAWILIA